MNKKKILNKNGLVSMTVVYSFLIMFLLLITSIMGIYLQKIRMVDGTINKIKGNIESWHASTGNYKSIVDLYNEGVLLIGDFVDYDAGRWTTEEINGINLEGSNGFVVTTCFDTSNCAALVPSGIKLSFLGFKKDTSRNSGALEPYMHPVIYKYPRMYDIEDKDKYEDTSSIDEVPPLSGWRIFDINDNEIVLVSAANPERYVDYSEDVNHSAISQYILTGTGKDDYEPRNWNMYKNNEYTVVTGARMLTYTDLKAWFKKYVAAEGESVDSLVGDNTIFQKIYTSHLGYQNLIDNHTQIWLGDTNGYMYATDPHNRYIYPQENGDFGIRILVILSADAQVKVKPKSKLIVTEKDLPYGTNNLYDETTEQIYKLWELKK